MTPLPSLQLWVIFAATAAHIIETWLDHVTRLPVNDR